MALPAGPVAFAQENCPFFPVLVVQEERVDRKPAVLIDGMVGKEAVDLILGNESRQIRFPCEALPGSIGDSILPELTKLCSDKVWFVEVEPHDSRIFFIGQCKTIQAVAQVFQKGRICQAGSHVFFNILETAPEDRRVFKHDFADSVREVPFHVGEHAGVLQHGIVPGSVQNSLRCILALPQQFSDPSGDIFPGQESLVHEVVFYSVALRDL